MLWLYFCSPQGISIRRRSYGNKAQRKAAIAVEEGLILQYVHGPDISDPCNHGSDRSGEGRASDSRTAGRSALRSPAESGWHYRLGRAARQGITETLHTLQTLLLKLIRREELVFARQSVGLRLLKEAIIEARSGREIVFEELVEKPWMAKGKSKETMSNFFDMKSHYATEYVDSIIAKIKRDLEVQENKS
jgi:hypothetical protein